MLTYRLADAKAPGYRILFEGVEIGSVSKRVRHTHGREHWHWGVGIMPLDGSRRPAAQR